MSVLYVCCMCLFYIYMSVLYGRSGNRIEQMLKIPCPVQIPFPSEHLSGAIDSENEHQSDEDDEDEEEDKKVRSSTAIL